MLLTYKKYKLFAVVRLAVNGQMSALKRDSDERFWKTQCMGKSLSFYTTGLIESEKNFLLINNEDVEPFYP